MRHMLTLIGSTLLSLLVISSAAYADAQAKYQACAACHGEAAQGNVELQAPALAGQDAAYLARQIQHFKAGIRGADSRDTQGAQMKAMAATLSDDDIVVLTEYLAALPPPVRNTQGSGDLKNGNNYYHAACGACHGGQAQGNPDLNAPALVVLDATGKQLTTTILAADDKRLVGSLTTVTISEISDTSLSYVEKNKKMFP